MGKTVTIAAAVAALLVLAGCSKATQDNARKTADSVGDDVAAAASQAGGAAKDAADKAGHDINTAAKQGADALGDAAGKAAKNAGAALNKAGKDIDHEVDKHTDGKKST